MAASFESAKELREVIDQVFSMMDADPEMGPKLRDADTPQRFEFSDFDIVVNIRAARDGEEGNLHWEWSDDVDWDSKVQMTMSSEVANRYFQGKENVPMAVARRRIKTGGRPEGGAGADPDHQADLQAVPRLPRAREGPPAGLTPSG